ncbi:MAG: branched-chain amino acid ABC transporter substrate-binding protein [Dactylosporangium sp.]|nr:branched-chain amino acid ABC transporter substrate-binding protein [Dactylosporangium sp.]NNJ62880.1 branched-chain amino acid ABC transporter substrate-binding protein [Dactylosporangium sp.]
MIRRIGSLAAVAALGLAAGACGDSGSGGVEEMTLVVGIDLPLQGVSKDASTATVNAMKLYLEQVGGKAGDYNIELKVYDDSTAVKGGWDDSTCTKNAQEHVATENEVAVMGTYNSGCAKIQLPVLNQAPDGPLLMVSHGNTNPGLTKPWDADEPGKYYPTDKRSYARVIATDEYQGAAAAQLAVRDLQVEQCYVLNDGETYGQGVARSFIAEAERQGVTVLGEQSWDSRQPNYEALFTQIKAQRPDCLYVGGIYDNNGGQLIKDKVKVLGDNTVVKMIGPDGFTGFPDLQQQPEADGMYLTFTGLAAEQLRASGGPGAKLLDAYKAKYGADPASSFALYGVQALQVILAAVAKSDGTRENVNSTVFTGEGIMIPAATAVLGKDISIDPSTGDVNVRDISVFVIKDKQEAFHKPWPMG